MSYADLPGRTFTGYFLRDAENLSSAVHQAIGAASGCWEDLAGAGTFDAETALAVADELLDYIHTHYAPRERPL